jgi:DNA ligase 1
MLLAELADVSRKVAATSRRTGKTELLADVLRCLPAEEIETGAAFLAGFVRQGKVGIGYATLRDLSGSPAESASLTLLEVDRALDDIAASRSKKDVAARLFARATAEEQAFLTGLLTGELRQGALEGVFADALAKAAGADQARVRRAIMMAGEIPAVARTLLTEGEAALSQYDVRLFRPVQPMLAQTAEDVGGALAELGEAALEYKFDGARVQVHRSGSEVRVYTRSLNDVTHAVPEVVESALAMPCRDIILDGEVLTFGPGARPAPFQVTMRRFGRKLDVDSLRAELPLRPVWFDALFADGGSLIDETQQRRFDILRSLTPDVVPHLRTADPAAASAFVEQALDAGHEGVMAKSPQSAYAAGARGASWLKIKQPRTLDLVILAAEWGSGRRQGWLSNLHLGARDTKNGGFAMLGKTFKGLTDEMLAWQTQTFLELEMARDKYTVYLRPELVAEIAFNEIQVSPRYPSGLALRFARVKRYRPDKRADEADTFETVQRMAGVTAS